MKKIIVITLSCLMVFALCSTAFAEEAKSALPEGFKLGLCNINERGAFGLMVKMGFKDACEKRGWELIYADNNSDGPTGVSNAEIVAQKGAQFVVDLNVDASVGQVIMDIFNEANIPVLAVDIALPGAPFFGIDSPAMGYYNGEVMADWLKENKLPLTLIVVWIFSQVFEMSGGRADMVGKSVSYEFRETLTSMLRTAATINRRFAVVMFILLLVGIVVQTEGKEKAGIKATAFWGSCFLLASFYLLLSCSKTGHMFVTRPDVFYGLFFFGYMTVAINAV